MLVPYIYGNSDQRLVHTQKRIYVTQKVHLCTLNGFCGGSANARTSSSEDDDARTDDGDARRLLSDDDDGGEKRAGGDGAQTRGTTRDDAKGTNDCTHWMDEGRRGV